MKTFFTFTQKISYRPLLPVLLMFAYSLMASGQTLHVIEVKDFEFNPAELQIAVGDTVEWQNVSGSHNVNGTRETYPSNPESFGNEEGEGWTYRHVFSNAGNYDYRCDPHFSVGMTGNLIVVDDGDNVLTVEFSEMDPHIGQDIYLAVINAGSGKEAGRVHAVADASFSMKVPGIEAGNSYYIDFWVDFNENGRYDTPPVDHAWRLELNDVEGDTTLRFTHNTNFENIPWTNRLTVEFSGMTPHIGQDIYLAVTDSALNREIGRAHTIGNTTFAMNVPGLEPGRSYVIDIWADFNENGRYDAPPADHAWRLKLKDAPGDTTLMFDHNTNFTDIMWPNLLTVEFNDMTPHVGQDFYLAVVESVSGKEVGRIHRTATANFTVEVPGIETGKSYKVNFWADFNENDRYDAPPADHAWQLDLDNVVGDTTLEFTHNTDFTDILWKSRLTVEFSNMNPHKGQDFYLAVKDSSSGMEIGRVHTLADTAFTIDITGIEPGKTYQVDFWADFNENGMYDAPPADHAWRLNLTNVSGDTTLMFEHNTNFTDIMWKNLLTVEFTGMNPHVRQDFYLAVVDARTDSIIGQIHTIADSSFSVQVPGIETGKSYLVNFWADFNQNGMYDSPPADHAWQLELNNVEGDTTLTFAHNTNFTDIMWKNTITLTVEFNDMTPHEGQDFYLAVTDTSSGMEVGRVHAVAETSFSLEVTGIRPGRSYYVDFWADFNENGMYDAPPADHAWRLRLNNVTTDTTLTFTHNTDFTDIMWKYLLTVEFSEMNPHEGQDFYLAVTDTLSGTEVGRMHTTADTAFTVEIPGIEAGKSYHVDFWADFNDNGMYDAPPEDHAWRINLNDVVGDTTLMFTHNTNFTDIMWRNKLTVEFRDMTPHLGQMLELYVVNSEDESIQDTVILEEVTKANFTIHSYSIQTGESYAVNFWADFNENGTYDPPPADHAWQLILENVTGDTTLLFIHNTNFTDIFPVTSSPLVSSAEFKMYPNPATDKVWIETSHLNMQDYSLRVYDVSGRLTQILPVRQSDRIQFSVRNLDKGLYFIELKSSQSRQIMKLIKK